MIPISYNLRNLRVRKATTVATALGVGLVVFVLAAALMLSEGLRQSMTIAGSPDTAIVLRKGADGELSSSIEDKYIGIIAAAPGVRRNSQGQPEVLGEVVTVVQMATADGTGMSNVLLRGIPETVLGFRPQVKLVEGRPPKPGTTEVMVGRAIAHRFENLELGGEIELRKNVRGQVVGIFSAEGSSYESEAWVDVYVLREAFGRDGAVSSVRVRLESPEAFDGFEAAVEFDQRLGLEAYPEPKFYEDQSEGTALFITGIGVTVTVFFSVGAMIGAMITMYGAVSQRGREIGVLRALGFSRINIMLSFLFESILLSLLGAALGVAGSLVLGSVEFSILNFQTFSEMVFRFRATPEILLIAAVAGGAMGIFGGFLPAIRAARVLPIEAMRG